MTFIKLFDMEAEENLVRDFKKENHTLFDTKSKSKKKSEKKNLI